MAALLHHGLVLFLVLVFPVWDRVETRRLKTSPDPLVRVRSYQKTIAWQVVATVVLLATVPPRLLLVPPDATASLGIEPSPRTGALVLLAMLAGAVVPVLLTARNPEARERLRSRLESIEFVLPRTPAERRWFAALCVVVGVCEEAIFRGFLIRYLEAPPLGLGLGGAVAAAAVIFGIDHGYQGWTGILATTAMALAFTALFFVTGSLWIPMAMHALIDLRVLLLLRAPAP